MGNPKIDVLDITAVADVAHQHGIPQLLIIHSPHHIYADLLNLVRTS